MPHTYSIDNEPVELDIENADTIRLVQRAGTKTAGIEISVTLDQQGTGAGIDHRITNRNLCGMDTLSQLC